MAEEFDRALRWTDWRGAEHSLRGEWAYVTGRASRCDGCSAGVRAPEGRHTRTLPTPAR